MRKALRLTVTGLVVPGDHWAVGGEVGRPDRAERMLTGEQHGRRDPGASDGPGRGCLAGEGADYFGSGPQCWSTKARVSGSGGGNVLAAVG